MTDLVAFRMDWCAGHTDRPASCAIMLDTTLTREDIRYCAACLARELVGWPDFEEELKLRGWERTPPHKSAQEEMLGAFLDDIIATLRHSSDRAIIDLYLRAQTLREQEEYPDL